MNKTNTLIKNIFFAILCLSLSISLNAQDRGQGQKGGSPEIEIKGKVIDTNSSTPLEFATVSIFKKSDNSLISGGLTEMDGTFSINIKPQPAYAVIEFIGFKKVTIDPIPIDQDKIKAGDKTVDLGEIKSMEESLALEEIEVRAEKSETQFSLDKRIFNVGKDLANQGGTASEILDNVPSITVSIEGEVSLRGSTGVRILVNGRPSNLASADNANSLRQIPANMIERVEVITNPSARYEAEGMSGIINIILKKEKRSGFNGSFDITGGIPERYGAGANLNYRKGKINWFVNYGLNYRSNPGRGSSFQTLERESSSFITEQIRAMNRSGLSNSLRAGVDYFISDKESITGALLYRISNEDNFGELFYNDYIDNYPGNLILESNRTDDEKEDESGLEYSINYRKEFSSREHTLELSAQYEDDLETESSIFLENIKATESGLVNTINQRSANDEGNRRWIFQMDYKKPISKDNKYEFGLYASLRDIDNSYLVEEQQNNEWISLEGLSNDFDYDEDVMAAYFQYGNKLGKFNYQIGLRSEYSLVTTELKQTNEVNDRDYMNLFPSAFLSYKASLTDAIQISYSRRIRRPRFWDLNPFFTFSDNRNFFSGNPDLDPELTDSYELNYLKYLENLTFSAGIFYRKTNGVITRIQRVNDDGTTITQPENLNSRQDMGLEFTTSYSGIKWMRLDATLNAYAFEVDGQNIGSSFQANALTWDTRLTSRITVWKSDVQIRANYRAPRETTQGRTKSITSIDLGWSKDFLKSKNATITLSVRDLLNSRIRRSEVFGENFFRESEFQWRSRSANLTLNYRINQKKKRGGQRGGGGDYGGGEF
jgi:outer membrane receptor protein involved in Fe transport